MSLPDNKAMAINRLTSLRKRLARDDELLELYTKAMEDYISKGYAAKVPEEEVNSMAWYIPHHAVTHPRKPGKVRIVFDCAAKYWGQSLKEALLQGPDLTNSLVGVLTRFREERIALVADVQEMFYQVAVDPSDHGYLRFLWWPGGMLNDSPKEYYMKVHLFGARSSPSCASFCLKQAAEDSMSDYPDDVVQSIKRNFYVDDYLKSVANEEEAIQLVRDATSLLKSKGFRLTKWLSDSKKVISHVDEAERAKSASNLQLNGDSCSEHILGVHWNVSSDSFGFKVNLKQLKTLTRREILLLVCSLYDPLGFVAPVTVIAKIAQQDFCRQNLGWDDPISLESAKKLKKWSENLYYLEKFAIPRALKPLEFGRVLSTELHTFADASSAAYSTETYLRVENEEGKILCAFIIGKARVAPLKSISIPRLELTAAILTVKLNRFEERELNLRECTSVFWTDSMAVLQSIRNEKKRFPVFVANILTKSQDGSCVPQWRYVDTKSNVADEGSRGVTCPKFV